MDSGKSGPDSPTPNVVYFGHLPPPIHGVAVITSFLYHSPAVKAHLNIQMIDISLSHATRNFGQWSLNKVVRMIQIMGKGLRALLQLRPQLVLYNCAPRGMAFYRDVLLTILIRLVSRAPLVFYVHGKGFQEKAKVSGIYRWCCHRLFRGSYAICLSDGLQKDLEGFGLIHRFTLSNAIPTLTYNASIPANKPFTFIFLSNFIRSKGVLDFVEALIRLKQQSQRPFAVVMIGSEYDVSNEDLRKKIDAAGLLPSLLQLGPVYGEEKERWLAEQSDVLVLPTYNDCFPIVILEAFRAGIPVVSTFVGAIPEMVTDEQDGFLVSSGDMDKLAEKMKFLLEHPEILDRMKINARKTFESRYELGKLEHGFVSIVKDILDRYGRT